MNSPVSHPDIRRIVSRLHVSQSYLSVCREVRKAQGKQWRKQPATHRRYAIAAAIQAHAYNKLEYRAVQSGQLSLLSRFSPRYFFNSDTKQVTIGS